MKMAELYAAADVFVSTSLSESFGLTAAEAMACGTPVVAFAAGGMVEVVGTDQRSGCLLPLGDVQGMAQALREAIEHPAALHAAGRAARSRMEQHFSRKQMCAAYARLYQGG